MVATGAAGVASWFVAFSALESRPLFSFPTEQDGAGSFDEFGNPGVKDSHGSACISFDLLKSSCLAVHERSSGDAVGSGKRAVSNILPRRNGSFTFVSFLCVSRADHLWFCLCSNHPCFSLLDTAVSTLKAIYLGQPEAASDGTGRGYDVKSRLEIVIPFVRSLIAQPFPGAEKSVDFVWSDAGISPDLNEEGETRMRLRPRMKMLPFVDDSALSLVLASLSLENVVRLVFQHLMVEDSLVVEASDLTKLAPFIEGVMSLMYPMKWQGMCLPLLLQDASTLHLSILQAHCPFIIGVHAAESVAVQAKLLANNPDEMRCVLVNLDNGSLHACTAPGAVSAVSPSVALPEVANRIPMQIRSSIAVKECAVEHESVIGNASERDDRVHSLPSSGSSASLTSLTSCESRLSSTSTRMSAASSSSGGAGVGGQLSFGWALSRRFIDACRATFIEVALHFFSESRLYALHLCFNREKELEYMSAFDAGDRAWLERVVKSRAFSDLMVRLSCGKGISFTALSRAWNDVEGLVKQKTMFQVLLKLILELDAGYSVEMAKNATVQLMQLPFDELNEVIRSITSLKSHLAGLDQGSEELLRLRRASLKRSIRRPKEKRCPPVVVRACLDDRAELGGESVSRVDTGSEEASGGWSANGARLCAVSLTGVVELDHFDALVRAEKADSASLVYAIHRDRSFYRDTIATLSRTQSAQNLKDLAAENERLKQELARMKMQSEKKNAVRGRRTSLESYPEGCLEGGKTSFVHPLKRSESEGCSIAWHEAGRSGGKRHTLPPSPLGSYSASRESLGLLRDKENRTFKFEPQAVRRRTSVLFKQPSA